jgi:hypothetical protein
LAAKRLVVDANSRGVDHLDYRAARESDSLGQWDLVDRSTGQLREATVVIESVAQFVPAKPRSKKNSHGQYVPEKLNKFEIRFVSKRKAMIAGPTVQATIASMYGNKLTGWIGKKVTLYVDPEVRMGSKKTGGLRIRNMAPTNEPTDEPLDNEVDERVAAVLDDAFGREPGSDDQ